MLLGISSHLCAGPWQVGAFTPRKLTSSTNPRDTFFSFFFFFFSSSFLPTFLPSFLSQEPIFEHLPVQGRLTPSWWLETHGFCCVHVWKQEGQRFLAFFGGAGRECLAQVPYQPGGRSDPCWLPSHPSILLLPQPSLWPSEERPDIIPAECLLLTTSNCPESRWLQLAAQE